MKIANAQRTARIQFDVVENRETGGAPPVYRQPQRVSAESFSLALRDFEAGRIEHRQQVDAYTDRVILRRVQSGGSLEQHFSFTDNGTRQGDYYYLRVVQSNDGIGWSSPVWIGGHPKQ